MAQVSIGQVENLEDLMRGLRSVGEGLDAACRRQIASAESKWEESRDEVQTSEGMLDRATQQEQAAQQVVVAAQQHLGTSLSALSAAEAALGACNAGPRDEDGTRPECSGEEGAVDCAQGAVDLAQEGLAQAQAALEQATANRQAMEQRVGSARQAQALADLARQQAQAECAVRSAAVHRSIDLGTARLTAAQQALNAYFATNPSAEQFHRWLNWTPTRQAGPVTPEILRERMNLPPEHRRLLQENLYERDPGYRRLVDRYRGEWAAAQGDVERNLVGRKARRHLSGAFGEHLARHALAPLGGRIETQGRTFVGDQGRYTKTDLIVTDLHVAVILGRGEGMGAPVGGSLAFEVKCGKANYLYGQKEHMVFQAEGHKEADAHCTFSSRDIHDLPTEKEKELRDTLREAGSPLVGMLPRKDEIDQSCLNFIRESETTP